MLRTCLLLFPLLSLLSGCDNIGRAFDPNVDPNGPGPEDGTSAIQVVPIGGVAREGRPQVRAAYPEGAGWPGEVPIVVEFSESVNADSILPTSPTGVDGRIGVRIQGSTQLLPAQYDLLANGQLLVIRPLNGLSNDGTPVYEVVLLPEGRDTDGVRFQVSGDEEVLTDFQVNQGEGIDDGRIVAIFPRDNRTDVLRENKFYVVFDRPANTSTLLDNLWLQMPGGSPITGAIEVATQTVGNPDARVVSLQPAPALQGSTRYEFYVNEDITFGTGGNLDFNGRTPFSVFDTVAPARPKLVELANPTAGFNNKINGLNVTAVRLNVTTPDDTQPGDMVRARIYGEDALTTPTFDLNFVEATATATGAGEQVVELDFTGQLGSVPAPAFEDGDITFVAQMMRGSQSSGFMHDPSTEDEDFADVPRFDVTPPTLLRAVPGNGFDIYTDQSSLAFYGIASEEISTVTLADGVNPEVTMFGANEVGRFLVRPLPLGRLTAARPYNLSLRDASGNPSEAMISGNIRQRGWITGTLAGTLTVEAYDHSTLEPVVGATVLVDPGVPVVPEVGQLMKVTGADGRATFTPPSTTHTITIVAPGYDLISVYNTTAASVSLPLTPQADASASLGGLLLFDSNGRTALVSTTANPDAGVLGTETSSASPTMIPSIPVLPNRPQIVTAFVGDFEATALPTYDFLGCQLIDITTPSTSVTPTAPVGPTPPGEQASVTMVFLPETYNETMELDPDLFGPFTEDFATANGLDTANLLGSAPRARITNTLFGFSNQILTGVGGVTSSMGTSYTVEANYSLTILAAVLPLTEYTWLVMEAEDTAGRISRSRALVFDTVTGTVIADEDPIDIPLITAPAGPFTGSPQVTFDDVVDRQVINGGVGIACIDITATDGNGRRWLVLQPDDDDDTGTDDVQFPDTTAAGDGLAAGTWNVVVESRMFLGLTLPNDIVLADRIRDEAYYARSATTAFTVQ